MSSAETDTSPLLKRMPKDRSSNHSIICASLNQRQRSCHRGYLSPPARESRSRATNERHISCILTFRTPEREGRKRARIAIDYRYEKNRLSLFRALDALVAI